MLQSIASYIWGGEVESNEAPAPEIETETEESEVVVEFQCDDLTEDDDETSDQEWLIVPNKDIESDFSEQEDDMTVGEAAKEDEEVEKENNENKPPEAQVTTDGKPAAAKRQILLKRVLMKDWNEKTVLLHKNASSKKLKRINMVRTRVNGTRKTKQVGRMEGKHTGMAGQRAK